MSPSYDQVAAAADEIESEMRRIGVWQTEPLPAEAYNFTKAFGADTMSFESWLQFVFLPRVREIVASHGRFPSSSSVGTYAIRNLDGDGRADRLVSLLCTFDGMFNRDEAE